MDSIPWSSSKTEENHGLFGGIGGERLGLYICAAGGALFGTMSWGAALASSRYAEEIRRSCARNEALLKINASKFDDAVHRLSAVSSGLDEGVSFLNGVSGTMQRVWKQDADNRQEINSESRLMNSEIVAKVNEIAESVNERIREFTNEYSQISDSIRIASAQLESGATYHTQLNKDSAKLTEDAIEKLSKIAEESHQKYAEMAESAKRDNAILRQISDNATAYKHSSTRLEQAADKLEESQRQHEVFVGTLNSIAAESQRRIDIWQHSMEAERQKIEDVTANLYIAHNDLNRSIDKVNATGHKLSSDHEKLKSFLDKSGNSESRRRNDGHTLSTHLFPATKLSSSRVTSAKTPRGGQRRIGASAGFAPRANSSSSSSFDLSDPDSRSKFLESGSRNQRISGSLSDIVL
jgi:chromosome segregation ATPase